LKLNARTTALKCGLVWGSGVFAAMWWMMGSEGPTGEATIVERLCHGFLVAAIGSLMGLAWTFAHGCRGGLGFARIDSVRTGKRENPE
jgi:hypothetical protein